MPSSKAVNRTSPFAIVIGIVAVICAAYAYFIIPGNFPTSAGGNLHLRDELIRLSEP